jgi:hypothetical protein
VHCLETEVEERLTNPNQSTKQNNMNVVKVAHHFIEKPEEKATEQNV